MKGVPKDFCDHAPTQLVKLCKAEQLKCKTSSKEAAKQKACWDDKMKELIALSKRGSGSGTKKPMTTKKADTSKMCAENLKMLSGFTTVTDVSKVSTFKKHALCLAYSKVPALKRASIKIMCKS